jgi:tetratricopeptide (TPR) repeat protein
VRKTLWNERCDRSQVMHPFFAVLLFASLSRGLPYVSHLSPQELSPLQRARQLETSGKFEEANELLADFAQRKPADTAVLIELGRVQMKQGLNDDAMRSFGAALAVEPHSISAREGEVKAAITAALVDRNAGDDDGALSCLLRAVKLVPDSPELLTDFGIQADSMQIYRDADTALTHAHVLDPANPKILYALARVELDEQKTDEAESNLRAYLKVRPDDATAHYGLGRLLHMVARNDEARVELERSIALHPRQSESYYELGEVALDLHQDAEAKAEYEKVLAVAPQHGGALTGMGILAFRAKDYAAAEKYLRTAVMYAPDHPKAHQFYAMTLAQLGRKTEAERETAVAQDLIERQNKLSHGYFLTTPP